MSANPANPESLAIKRNFLKLKQVVTRGDIPFALLENDLVTTDTVRMVQDGSVLLGYRAQAILLDVLNAVEVSPSKFENFCTALSVESVTESTVKSVRDSLKSLKEDPEYICNEEFKVLENDLNTLSRLLSKASSERNERSIVGVIQENIKQYIEKAMNYVSISKIESDLSSLIEKVAIPTELWGWVQQEITEFKKRPQSEVVRVVPMAVSVRPPSPQMPLFCKESVYHAAMCCAAISNQANAHTFFQRQANHGFSEVSFSQMGEGITPYLIAIQDDILYVAFQGIQSLNKWAESKAGSFDEVLAQQCSEIPLRFFVDQLNNNKKIVFTGFSFGGMLACCVCVKLWQTTTKQEVLLERTACITFAQPFLSIKMVDNEIAIYPKFERSIHCIFNAEDFVPLLIRCSEYLIPIPKVFRSASDPASDVNQRTLEEHYLHQPVDLFRNELVKQYIKSLGLLQNCSTMVISPGRDKMADARKQAVEIIRKALNSIAHVKARIEGKFYGSSYVISREKERGAEWQQKTNIMAAVQLGHRTNGIIVKEDLFKENDAENYMSLIYRSHIDKAPDRYNPPAAVNVKELAMLRPKIIELDIHEHPDEHALVLKGENLWFSYKICFHEKDKKHEVCTTPGTTTYAMVEFKIPRKDKAHTALFGGKQARITLFSHFDKPIRQLISTKKETHVFSVRESQLAKHTPTQIIQLAFLCVIFEQRGHGKKSARFEAIAKFLEEVVKVVPLESVFDAIAYEDHDIALECAKALEQRNPQLQLSHQMIVGAGVAATRASSGYRGDALDDVLIPLMFAHNMLAQLFSDFEPLMYDDDAPPIAHEVESHDIQKPFRSEAAPQSSKKRPSYSSITKNGSAMRRSSSGDVVSAKQHATSAPVINLQPPPFIPVPIPIILNKVTQPRPFPQKLIDYLNGCVEKLLKKMQECNFDASAVGNTNIEEVYPVAGTRRKQYFKSPIDVLRDAMNEIEKYTEETHRINPSKTEASNKRMLNLIDKIYNRDVAVCAALLGAFMEQQIRIPLINSAKETADEIAQAAPVAVGVWALFSQNLRSLQSMLSSPDRNALFVEIKEYIKGIGQQLDIDHHENVMYAGKLQFLLQGIKETVTASSEYISYSLERQLYDNLKFDKSISLKQLIIRWDELFQGDALSLIGMSHRSLVARWMKWTILVHSLRKALSEHTCIGVTGLVNSGKSLLVKRLFQIEKVKVGTRAVKRTTLPLLYNLEEKIDGLDVIDFPGVDDGDSTVPEMAKLLLSVAQIVVFVVDYRKAKTDPVKEWLHSLTSSGVPVLVCLTYADVFYLECKDDQCESMIKSELNYIQKNLKLMNHPTASAAFFSFNNMSGYSEEELMKYGIKSLSHVGDWLVETLKSKFNQTKLAENLAQFLSAL